MKFAHKGYTLAQEAIPINYHYMIFAEDGHMVMHVPYDKIVTEEKAKEFIENYISFAETLKDVGDKFFEKGEEADI